MPSLLAAVMLLLTAGIPSLHRVLGDGRPCLRIPLEALPGSLERMLNSHLPCIHLCGGLR
jgi:hypothetical protein